MCEYKEENKCTVLQNKCEKDVYGECAFAEINDDEIVKMAKQIVEIGNKEVCKYCKKEFNYMDVNIIYEDKIDICFSVNGGYERDCNAYWGGEEYVDDLMKSLVIPKGIKVTCELDEEDMTGNIIISRGEEMKQQIENMTKISINGFDIDVRKINYINIIEVSDENDKMYITINLAKHGVIRTTTTNPNDVDGWDRLTDVGSIKGTKAQLIDVLKEESFL